MSLRSKPRGIEHRTSPADILGKDPDYPWAHSSQLEIFRVEAFRDRARLQLGRDTLARVCAAWIEPYRYLNAMDG